MLAEVTNYKENIVNKTMEQSVQLSIPERNFRQVVPYNTSMTDLISDAIGQRIRINLGTGKGSIMSSSAILEFVLCE